MESLGCPTAETGSNLGLYSIAESYNYIEVVVSDLILFPIRSSCSEFPNN